MDDLIFEKRLTAALYRAAELDCGTASPADAESSPTLKFQREMRALLRNPRRYIQNLRRPVYVRALRSAAAVFAAVAVLFGAAMAASPTVRAAVSELVRSWLVDRTRYDLTDKGLSLTPGEWTFGYIPEGFALIEDHQNEINITRIYQNSESKLIMLIVGTGSVVVDNEHSEYYQTKINGHTADVYESNTAAYPNNIVMYFESEHAIAALASEIEINELIKIGENINK
jgi:hypothetical protein